MVMLYLVPQQLRIWCRQKAKCEYDDSYGPCARWILARKLRCWATPKTALQRTKGSFCYNFQYQHTVQRSVRCPTVNIARYGWSIYPKRLKYVVVEQISCILRKRYVIGSSGKQETQNIFQKWFSVLCCLNKTCL